MFVFFGFITAAQKSHAPMRQAIMLLNIITSICFHTADRKYLPYVQHFCISLRISLFRDTKVYVWLSEDAPKIYPPC